MTDVGETSGRADAILDEVERAVVGKRPQLELLLVAVLADGHVLLEDFPGLAKTLIARSIARVTNLTFGRIQFTPDLVPSDITGGAIYDPARASFDFRPGPIFANLLLGDEINRAPPKTQAALLEAMEERQVTVDGVTHELDRPFLVIATQNPIEYEGTYPLPEAQLDRFLVRLRIGYPSNDDEWRIVRERVERRTDEVELRRVTTRQGIQELQQSVEEVELHESVGRYIVELVTATRASNRTLVGASPRASIALAKCARALAMLRGRRFATPDDVKHLAGVVLAHRLVLRPELWVESFAPELVVQECLDSVPMPPAVEER